MHEALNPIELFDTATLARYQTIQQYLKEQSLPSDCSSDIKTHLETTVITTLKRLACIQFRYMELINDYADGTRSEVIDTFFSQSLFSDDPVSQDYYNADHIQTLYESLGIQALTKNDCVFELKNFQFDFYGIKFGITQISKVNKILSFVQSSYRLISSIATSWYSCNCVDATPYNNRHLSYLITKEHVIFPCIKKTLAAQTIDKHIYLRQSCIEFMYDMKWKNFEDHSQVIHFHMSDAYTISHCFQYLATEAYQQTETFQQQISDRVSDNVFAHELGHLIWQYNMDTETIAIMKKLAIYPISLFESCDECLADIAPSDKRGLATLLNIEKVANTDVEKAVSLFFTYASDTWFFDTDDESMFEYSEMFHLILLRYIKKNKRGIDFKKMKMDFDLDNPRSFLTVFLVRLNTVIDAFKEFIKKQTYHINGRDEPFTTLDAHTHKTIMEQDPMLELYSYKYYSLYWANIMVLVKTFLTNKKGLAIFSKQSKKTMYGILFKLTTKKELSPDDAREYIISTYKKRLPIYMGKDMFQDDFFNV